SAAILKCHHAPIAMYKRNPVLQKTVAIPRLSSNGANMTNPTPAKTSRGLSAPLLSNLLIVLVLLLAGGLLALAPGLWKLLPAAVGLAGAWLAWQIRAPDPVLHQLELLLRAANGEQIDLTGELRATPGSAYAGLANQYNGFSARLR